MNRKLEIEFILSVEKIIESVHIVEGFIPFLEKRNMFYSFPFQSDILAREAAVEEQILNDIHKYRAGATLEQLTVAWNEKESLVTQAFADICGVDDFALYKCILTFYGPYGYYHTPNTIYINISKGAPNKWIETCVHELLHLVLFEETKDLSYEAREQTIDSKFDEIFGHIFPQHHVQQF